MTDKSAREIIAATMRDACGLDFLAMTSDQAADEILVALQAGGFAVVPKNIDTGNIALIEAINGGGCQGWSGQIIDSHIADARRRWRRILSAMLLATSGPKGEEG